MMSLPILVWVSIAILVLLWLIVNALYRVAVPTNQTHVVQSKDSTKSYGKNQEHGSVYFNWPSWLPAIGITRTILPTTVFDITIENYQAYDIGRVPFGIDVKAFFRISNSSLASERIDNFEQLISQLHDVLKSSIRSILSNSDIEDILSGRSEFSEKFTLAVKEQLNKDWWVEVVKNIEFMEIRDGDESEVISNIQKKKESEILKNSRIAIAENNREASLKEIEAQKEVEVKEQEKRQLVGQREIETNKELQLQQEVANQLLNDQNKITKEKEMEVIKVNEVKNAEIEKEREIINAEKIARTQIIQAEAEKERQSRQAEAQLITEQKKAEWTKAIASAEADKTKQIWLAEAEAISKKEIALVSGKVELMEKMQKNTEYAEYLQAIESINSQKEVGIAQAEALKSASIKYLGTDGKIDPSASLKNLLTPTWLAQFGMGINALTDTVDTDWLLKIFQKFQQLPKDKQDKIITEIEQL